MSGSEALSWRHDGWYVLSIARVLDCTPQNVLDQTWEELQEQLGEEGIYKVARIYRSHGSTQYYTREHLRGLRKRGRL